MQLPLVLSLLSKLLESGKHVRVDMHGAEIRTGKATGPFEIVRPRHEGWIIFHAHSPLFTQTFYPRLENHSGLLISSYEEHAYEAKGPLHSGFISLQQPVDEFYTLKKIDGIWTLVDAEGKGEIVHEENEKGRYDSLFDNLDESMDVDDDNFIVALASKRLKANGIDHDVRATERTKRQFIVVNDNAGRQFKILYDSSTQPNGDWMIAPMKNLTRTGQIKIYDSLDSIIDLLKKEME